MTAERYRACMDRVKASDGLHRRLLALPETAPAAKKALWLPRAAALAACAVLAVGVWACGLQSSLTPQPGAVSSTALAEAPPDTPPGPRTLGGYETRETRAGVEIAVYHILPWVDYGENGQAAAAADWDFPPDTVRLELTDAQIAALLGGAEVLDTHLDWGAYALTGRAALNEDGTLAGACLAGSADESARWECMVWRGALPPACLAVPGGVGQTVWDVAVTAHRYNVPGVAVREVSFLAGDGYGYRFSVTDPDAARAETLVSRFLRRMILDGVCPDCLTVEGEIRQRPAQQAPEESGGNAAASVPPRNAGE